MIINKITKDDLKIRIHHVGGIGSFGPTEALKNLGDDVEWIIYDADEKSLMACDDLKNINHTLINRCLGGTNSKTQFNIMAASTASSMLAPAPSATQYTMLLRHGRALIWGEHACIIKSVEVEVNTLDWLVDNKIIPPIDFLSIDAQGAELEIIIGASKMVTNSILGIVCEVEFNELYEGQPLFCDIQNHLRDNNFCLCQIYNHQYMNTAPYVRKLMGKGFYIVGEALFLKNINKFIDVNKLDMIPSETLTQGVLQCLKIAAIAVIFDQLEFALRIVRFLNNNKLISLNDLAKKTGVKYIKLLRDLTHAADLIDDNSLLLDSSTDVAVRKNSSQKKKISKLNEISIKLKLLSFLLRKLVHKKK